MDQRDTAAAAPAMEELARLYREPLVRHFIRRGLMIDVAEDCAQEVFVRMANVDLTTVSSPQAYLFSIASSVEIDRGRRLRAREDGKHDSIDNVSLVSGEPSPARVLEGRETLARLETQRMSLDHIVAPVLKHIFPEILLDNRDHTILIGIYKRLPGQTGLAPYQ